MLPVKTLVAGAFVLGTLAAGATSVGADGSLLPFGMGAAKKSSPTSTATASPTATVRAVGTAVAVGTGVATATASPVGTGVATASATPVAYPRLTTIQSDLDEIEATLGERMSERTEQAMADVQLRLDELVVLSDAVEAGMLEPTDHIRKQLKDQSHELREAIRVLRQSVQSDMHGLAAGGNGQQIAAMRHDLHILKREVDLVILEEKRSMRVAVKAARHDATATPVASAEASAVAEPTESAEGGAAWGEKKATQTAEKDARAEERSERKATHTADKEVRTAEKDAAVAEKDAPVAEKDAGASAPSDQRGKAEKDAPVAEKDAGASAPSDQRGKAEEHRAGPAKPSAPKVHEQKPSAPKAAPAPKAESPREHGGGGDGGKGKK